MDKIGARVNRRDDGKAERMKQTEKQPALQRAQPASCSLSFRNLKAAIRDEGLVLQQCYTHSDRQTGRQAERQTERGMERVVVLMCVVVLY